MADFEKVYNAYKNCSDPKFDCNKCIYLNNCKQLDADILELLKEHKAEVVELLEEQRGLYKEIERLRNELPKKGHWVKTTVRGSSAFGCSVCGCESGTLYDYAFCPNCGADMRGEQE